MKQQNKLALCQLYEEILYYIGVVNKGFILRSQLEEYCSLFTITIKTKYAFNKALKELQEGQIIKQISFMDTSRNIVMLKKFGIAYLKGFAENYHSSKIGAIKTCSTNERYLKSILLNEHILNNIKSNEVIKEKIRKQGIINFFNKNYSNFFLKTDEYCNLLEQKFSKYINLEYLKETKEKYIKERDSKKKATEISRQVRLDKGNEIELTKSVGNEQCLTFGRRNQKQRNELMQNGNIETLKKKGSYLRIIPNDDVLTVQLYYFDYKNQQDRLKMIEHLALTISICDNLFKANINVKYEFRGYVCNEIARKKALEELNDTIKVKDTLKNMYVLMTDLNEDNYNVYITNFDIENKYLNDMPVIRLDTEINKKKEREYKKLKEDNKEKDNEIERLKKLLAEKEKELKLV